MHLCLILLISGLLGLVPVPHALAQVATEPTIVLLDVDPTKELNVLNVKSKGKTDLAILGSEGLDTTTIAVETLVLEDAQILDCVPADVNTDGYPDLVCRVKTNEMGMTCGETEVALTGALLDGTLIQGSDRIATVGCKRVKNKPAKTSKAPKEPKEPKEPKMTP